MNDLGFQRIVLMLVPPPVLPDPARYALAPSIPPNRRGASLLNAFSRSFLAGGFR